MEEEQKRILSLSIGLAIQKNLRRRFPKCLLDKVGSLSQQMPRVFVYFTPFQKKYMKKLWGELHMKPCQLMTILQTTVSNVLCWSIAVSK